MVSLRRQFGAGFVIAAAVAAAPEPAAACGGTFCDSGPTSMPVDQTGENVLFVMDGQNVEAHVQIQYEGMAERFAWVVPMPKVPEVTVGSQLLFNALMQSTVPTYGFTSTFDQCGMGGNGGLGSGVGGAGGGAGSGGTGGTGGGGPNVVFTKTVGAFEVTVLQGGTPEEVSGWLSTNGYRDIPAAPALLRDYVQQNFVFAAIKLTGGADVKEIHPLVFRYAGTEPCVPLKLTAVAAVEDMGVRVFFLGDDRVFPTNYKHVELNPVRIDWSTFASNYKQAVGRAVDSAVANGQAFVTEYAGPSSRIANGGSGYYSPSWTEVPFATIAPERVIDELNREGLASCVASYDCRFNHPLLPSLLEQYLPPPPGVDPGIFYSDLLARSTQIDRLRWNAAKFAADLKARIVDPAKHANEIVNRYPYLTRMYTTISPAEMRLDPTFHARPDLSIDMELQTNTFATQRTTCGGKRAMILPDEREVALPNVNGWPVFSSLMPYAEKIEEVPLTGAVIELVNNTQQIDEQLALWNASQGWPPSGAAGSGGGGGTGARSSGGNGGASGSGASNVGGTATATGGTAQNANAANDGSGCACEVANAPASESLWLGLGAAALAWLRRQRRAQRPLP